MPLKILRFNSLDSLRGIAALLLVIFHIKGIPKLQLVGDFDRITSFFGAGVPLFYALSAFSLMIGYRDKLECAGGLVHFYIRRVFRILPLFYTLLVFFLLFRTFYFHGKTGFFLMTLNYLCVFGLIPGQHEGIVWASWSIGVEMLFYLIFPFALIASRTLASSSLVFLATLAISVSSQEFLGSLKDKAPSFAYMSISTQIVFFGAGLFAYRFGEFLAKKAGNIPEKGNRLLAEAIFLAGLGFLLLNWLTPMGSWAKQIHLGTQMLAFAWILMLAPVLVHGQLKTLAILPLERAGKISFSLYLLNPPVIYFLSQAGLYKYLYANISSPNLAFGICIVVTLAVLWPLSEATYYFIEDKGIRAGGLFLRFLQPVNSNEESMLEQKSRQKVFALVAGGLILPWLVWIGLSMFSINQKPMPPTQPKNLNINQNLTTQLHSKISNIELGAAGRHPNFSSRGISIPAGSKPTRIVFDVKSKFQKLNLHANLIQLPANVPERGGVVGVEILIDGQSQGRKVVDRHTAQSWSLDLSGAKELSVVVDNANGTDFWDWVDVYVGK